MESQGLGFEYSALRHFVMIDLEQYRSRLFSIARKWLWNYEDAEDLVQTTLVYAHKMIDKIEGANHPFLYVAAIMRKRYADFVKSQLRRPKCVDMTEIKDMASEQDIYETVSRKLGVEELCTMLTEEDVAMLELLADGATYDGIAMTLGRTRGRVASRIFEAREKARAISPRTALAGVV